MDEERPPRRKSGPKVGRKRAGQAVVPVMLYITVEQRARLDTAAVRTRWTLSAILREALDDWLRTHSGDEGDTDA